MAGSLQGWVSEHKLASAGTHSVGFHRRGASLSYARGREGWIHAQALTLAVLTGAAFVHYYSAADGAVEAERSAPVAADYFDPVADW